MKITAVIVTYNRLELLKKCVQSVQQQTVTPELIIVNNGSTDATADYLATLSGCTIIHQENVGAAGGFHTGIKAAHDSGADWVWTMDDDVTFDNDCLEQLLVHKDSSGCIHPRKFYSDGVEFPWEVYLDIDTLNTYTMNNASFHHGKEIVYVNVACFEGMLISRGVIDKIGYPDQRLFIVNDDTLYGFLASLHTNVAYVKKAVVHSAKVSTGNYQSDMFFYYYIRNMHILEEYINKLFPHANKKNQKMLFRLYVLKLLVKAPLKRKGMSNKFKTFAVVCRAYKDYLQKRTGKTF